MCQSIAEGGRRCAYHLEQAAGSAISSFASSVTGLAPSEVNNAMDDLKREGAFANDPTREEVDGWLEEQALRVRHEPSLSEAKRESILGRLRAAIGRITPSRETFYAWKNVMAESWGRVRRKAAAAFLVASVAGSITACGSVPAHHDQQASLSSQTSISATTDSTYQANGITVISPSAATRYGKANAKAGAAVAVAFTEKYTFRDDDIAAPITSTTYAGADGYMTQTCASDFDKNVAAVSKDAHAGPQAYNVLTAGFADMSLDGLTWRADGPKIVDRSQGPVTVSLDRDGRLQVKVGVSADLRMNKAGKPVLQYLQKDSTYWLKQVNGKWLIDGWSSSFGTSGHAPVPDAN